MSENGNKTMMHDPEGKPSSMRAMSFISLLAAISLAWGQIAHPDWTDDPTYPFIFLLGAFAPKVFQSFAERRWSTGKGD